MPFSGASSRWLQRYAPALLAVALIIAMSISLAWQAAGWLRLQRSPVAVAASPVSHESIRSDPTRLARLFGTSAQDPNAPPPATNLDLVLKGSFVQSDPKLSSAIIQRQGDKPHRYAVGGEISDGVKLHAVYRDRVELQRGGRLESLPFPHRSGDCWPARTTLQARTTRSNNCKACRMRTLQHCASAWTPCASRWKPRPSQNPPKKTRASPRPRLRKATDPMSQPLLRALFAPSSRSYVPAVLLSLALGIQAAHAENNGGNAFVPAGNQQEAHWTINLKDADIREFIDQISEITGETFVVDPRVKGQVSVVSKAQLSLSEVYQLFLSVMSTHGFTVVAQGDQARIVPNAEAKTEAGGGQSAPDRLETRVIQVQQSPVSELIPLIRPLVPQYGHLAAVPSANALIISDRSANIARIEDVIRQLDQKGSHDYSVINLRYGWVMDAAEVLNNAMSRGQAKGAAGAQVIADARKPPDHPRPAAGARQLVQLAQSLDTLTARSANTRVIRLRHNDAKTLAETLGQISEGMKNNGGQGGEQTGGGRPSNILIRADESTNALVLLADPDTVNALEDIVRQLDVPRAQVLVEAAIVEISGDIQDAVGVQWAINKGGMGGTKTNFANTGLSIGTLLQSLEQQGTGIHPRRRHRRHRQQQLRRAGHRALGQHQEQPAVDPEPVDPGQPESGDSGRPERTVPDRLLHHQQRRFEQPVHHRGAQGYRRQPQGHSAHQRRRGPAPGDRAGDLGPAAQRPAAQQYRPDHQQALDQEHHPRRERPSDRDRRPDPGRRFPSRVEGSPARGHPIARSPVPFHQGHTQAQPDGLPASYGGPRQRRSRRALGQEIQRHPGHRRHSRPGGRPSILPTNANQLFDGQAVDLRELKTE